MVGSAQKVGFQGFKSRIGGKGVGGFRGFGSHGVAGEGVGLESEARHGGEKVAVTAEERFRERKEERGGGRRREKQEHCDDFPEEEEPEGPEEEEDAGF